MYAWGKDLQRHLNHSVTDDEVHKVNGIQLLPGYHQTLLLQALQLHHVPQMRCLPTFHMQRQKGKNIYCNIYKLIY